MMWRGPAPHEVGNPYTMRWCVTGMPPTENRSIAVMPVGVAAARIRLPMSIQKLAARRFCTPTKNEAAYVALPARLGSLAQPWPVGSKKSSSASSFKYHLGHPGPRGSHFHDPGTGRTVVVCAQKSARLLDLDSSVPQDTAGGGVCCWGSEPARRASGCGRRFRGKRSEQFYFMLLVKRNAIVIFS